MAISLLVLWLLVSKEQHNRLLKAMLPGKVIKQLQVRSGQGTCMLSSPMSRDIHFKRPIASCPGYLSRVRSSLCAVFAASDLHVAALLCRTAKVRLLRSTKPLQCCSVTL